MDILALGRVHEDHVIGAFQSGQDVGRISLQQGDPLRCPVFGKVGPGLFDPLRYLFDGGDMTPLRGIVVHDQSGISHRRSDFQDLQGPCQLDEEPDQSLGPGPYDGNAALCGFLFQ